MEEQETQAEPALIEAAQGQETQPPPPVRRRRRTGRKRTRFQVPKHFPVPVRALWEHATHEEQQLAHQVCTALLEWWLGKTSRTDICQRLHLPPLRIWQLSQQAVAGMLAGVLKQPKARKGQILPLDAPEEDPKVLKKENAELKRQLDVAERVTMVLKQMPAHREGAGPSPTTKKATSTPPKKAGPRGPRSPKKHRTPAAKPAVPSPKES